MRWGVLDIEVDPERDDLRVLGWWPGTEDTPPDPATALRDPGVVKVCHSTFDVVWLRRHGVRVEGPVHDTMVMAWLVDENQPLTLAYLAEKYLAWDPDKRLRRSEGRVWFRCDDGREVPIGEAPEDQLRAYNQRDLKATALLYRALCQELRERFLWDHFLQEQVPFTQVLIEMELAGLPVDVERCRALAAELRARAEALEWELLHEAGLPPDFNLSSGDHVARYLYSETFELPGVLPNPGRYAGLPRAEKVARAQEDAPEGFAVGSVGRHYVHGLWTLRGRGLEPPGLTPSGRRPSVTTPDLLIYHGSDPWVQKLVEYRRLTKLLTTYLEKFPAIARNGRIYGRFHQTGTVTGRLSSAEPNLQNIPARGDLGRRVREVFAGRLIVGDFSQIEPRLMAHFSQDPVLLDTYRHGRDVYIVTATGIYGRPIGKDDPERSVAKTLVLAMGYGAGPAKLARILSLNGHPTTKDEAAALLDELQQLYATYFAWREEVIRFAQERGYVRTLGGRVRHLRGAFTDRRNFKAYGHGQRQAVNSVIQGSAADIVRRVMVRSRTQVGALRLLAQVHDELVWDYPYGATEDQLRVWTQMLRAIGELGHGYELSVPLVFEPKVCRTWADKDADPPPLDDEDEE